MPNACRFFRIFNAVGRFSDVATGVISVRLAIKCLMESNLDAKLN